MGRLLTLFRLASLRHLKLKPIRSTLTILGISFGVALYCAIEVINRSTISSFQDEVDAMTGKASLTVSGGETGFSENVLDQIKKYPGVKYAVPMVQERVFFQKNISASPQSLTVLGIDMLSESTVRTYKTDDSAIDDPLTFLNQADSIILTSDFAKEQDFKLNSTIELTTSHGKKRFVVRGLLTGEGVGKAYGGHMAIMDIDGARASFSKEGKLDRVDIVTADGLPWQKVQAGLADSLGATLHVDAPADQVSSLRRMVESYQGLLSLVSLLALLVGVIMVANSMGISVAERRMEWASLRALGANRSAILGMVVGEALLLGTCGSIVGIMLGRYLATLMTDMVSQSLTNEYFTQIRVRDVVFGSQDIINAFLTGCVSSTLAALLPAIRATRIHPLETIRSKAPDLAALENKKGLSLTFIAGAACFIYLAVDSYLRLSGKFPALRALAGVCLVVGSVWLCPEIIRGFILIAQRVMGALHFQGGNTARKIAIENLLRNPARTGRNIITLVVALMMLVVIATLNESLKTSISHWLDRVLQSDLMVSSPGRLAQLQVQPIREELKTEIEKIPGVDTGTGGVTALRYIKLDYENSKVALKAYDEPPAKIHYRSLDLIDDDPEKVGPQFFHSAEPYMIVSESFLNRFHRKKGDTIELNTATGKVPFKILASMNEFSSPEGVIYITREVYKKFWHDSLVTAFFVEIKDGAGLQDVRGKLDFASKDLGLVTTSMGDMRSQIIRMVDESFAYTRAIEIAALLIGLLNLVNTMLITVIERFREIGMLRAIGMSQPTLNQIVLTESAIQGLGGALVGVILGSYASYFWVVGTVSEMIGWRVDVTFPTMIIWGTTITGLLVGLLAGWLPARHASTISITEALSYE